MPWRSILSKDKSFPPLYLPFHQYRRTQCEGKPHFLLHSEYLLGAMWRVSFVMNSPEVIRNTLLFQEKNRRSHGDCEKVMMNKQKKEGGVKQGRALLAEKQMPRLHC